jgi:broad specificity phosphatase PhoE
MPTRVFLLRHAETADPTVFHGAESDVGLSERGRRQADAVAPFLAAQRPAHVVSSAMRRARDTAGPIAAACGLPLRIEPGLHERRVGPFAGTPTRDAERVYGDTLERWFDGDTGYAPPGVESFDAVRDRALPVWRRLADELAGQTYVVVAHGFLIRVLLLSVLPGHTVKDWHRIGPILNVGISELVRDGAGSWSTVRLNVVPEAVRDIG